MHTVRSSQLSRSPLELMHRTLPSKCLKVTETNVFMCDGTRLRLAAGSPRPPVENMCLPHSPLKTLHTMLISWYPLDCDHATDSRMQAMWVQMGDAQGAGALREVPESVLGQGAAQC